MEAAPIPGRAHRNAEHSRRAILEAAMREFAELGVDGARTDSIARSAGVNKALLYYYFHNKESLYGAVLDDVFSARFQGLKRDSGQRAGSRRKDSALCPPALRLRLRPGLLSAPGAVRDDACESRRLQAPAAVGRIVLRSLDEGSDGSHPPGHRRAPVQTG